MNVDWNQERNNDTVVDNNNTTSIVTGDFLNLFQSFGQSSNQQQAASGTLF